MNGVDVGDDPNGGVDVGDGTDGGVDVGDGADGGFDAGIFDVVPSGEVSDDLHSVTWSMVCRIVD